MSGQQVGSVYKPVKAGQNQEQFFQAILATIAQEGTQNEQYASDMDITYGKLKEKLAGRVGGLIALLKTLKRNKKVDYNDEGVMIKDDTVITLIGDDDNKTTDFVPYEEILQKLGAEQSSHAKVSGW